MKSSDTNCHENVENYRYNKMFNHRPRLWTGVAYNAGRRHGRHVASGRRGFTQHLDITSNQAMISHCAADTSHRYINILGRPSETGQQRHNFQLDSLRSTNVLAQC